MDGFSTRVNWAELIRTALDKVRSGTTKPVTGAQLRPVVADLAAEHGLDLTQYLREQGLTFSRLVERDGGLTVVRRAGTDMLVAASADEVSPDDLAQSNLPAATFRRNIIRPDLYNALTRFGTGVRPVYDPNSDRVFDLAEGDPIPAGCLPLPLASFEQEVTLRREFAEQHDQSLLGSLNAQRPLAEFREALIARGLLGQWHDWKAQSIRDRLVQWAADNHVEVRPEWFGATAPRATVTVSAAEVLKMVADYMTDDELRGISLPLRAVQAFVAEQHRRS